MKFKYLTDICPRIVITSFLEEEALTQYNQAFLEMFKDSVKGTYHKNLQEIHDPSFKARSEFYFRDFKNTQIQTMERIWWDAFWKKELREQFHNTGGIFSYINLFNGMSLLGSFYGEGNFYKEHADSSLVTAIFFHQEDKSFEGGELVLSSENEWSSENKIPKQSVKIPYERNTLIIFPSRYHHGVEAVTKSLKEGPLGMRLSTQCFMYFDENNNNEGQIFHKMKLLNK